MKNINLTAISTLALLGSGYSVAGGLTAMEGARAMAEPSNLLATAVRREMAPLLAMDSPGRIPGKFIVVFSKTADQAAIKAIANDIDNNRAQGTSPLIRFTTALKGFAGKLSNARLQQLLKNPDVSYIESDQEVRINAVASWGLDRSDQDNLPLDDSYTANGDGSGVHAYVIDTGIDITHADFGGRAVWDFAASGLPSKDDHGHGSHVAGTLGSTTYGIAKNVNLHAVKVLDKRGSGSSSGVISGVDWVAANHISPAVANMSLGGGFSQASNDAVANAFAAGVVFAVAAGNDSFTDACTKSPASEPTALTVGSTTSSDSISSFSNVGSCVDVFGPGSSIPSVGSTQSKPAKSTPYIISGTSMASPHVAGVAAVYRGLNPGDTPTQVNDWVVNNAVSCVVTGIPSSPSGTPNKLVNVNGSIFSGTACGGGGGGECIVYNDHGFADNISDTDSGGGPEAIDFTHFTWEVAVDACELKVTIAGPNGDADLYTRFNQAPTGSSYDCRPFLNGSNETCIHANPSAGTWWLSIEAFATYSGVRLDTWTQ